MPGGADVDNTDSQVQFRITAVPSHGYLTLGTRQLGVGSKFTIAELMSNLLSYTHDGSETLADSFDAKISDSGGGIEEEQTFHITILPQNDPPAATVPLSLIAVEAEAQDIPGLLVEDPDSVDATTGLVNGSFGVIPT